MNNSTKSMESMNTLCTKIFLAGSYKKLLFTSCHALEGTAPVANELFRTMAALGEKVVLVDANFHNSELALETDLPKDDRANLAQVVLGQTKDACVSVDGGSFVPAGKINVNPLRLILDEKFGSYINALAEKNDYILIAAPSMDETIDAVQIATFCDAAVFVLQSGVTRRKELLKARALIEKAGCDVLGVVMNEVPEGANI